MPIRLMQIEYNVDLGNTSGAVLIDSAGITISIAAIGCGGPVTGGVGGGGGGYAFYNVPNLSGGTLSSFAGLTLYYTIGTINDNYDTIVRVGGITMIAYRATNSTGAGATIIGGTGYTEIGTNGSGNTGGKSGGPIDYGNGISVGSTASKRSNGAVILKYYKDTNVTTTGAPPSISSTMLWIFVAIVAILVLILIVISIFVSKRKK